MLLGVLVKRRDNELAPCLEARDGWMDMCLCGRLIERMKENDE